MSEELLPCPFCGHNAKVWKTSRRYIVRCMDDINCAALISGSFSENVAVKAWNTRTEPANREIIEQAHMAGPADAGVDPGYSNAREYFDSLPATKGD